MQEYGNRTEAPQQMGKQAQNRKQLQTESPDVGVRKANVPRSPFSTLGSAMLTNGAKAALRLFFGRKVGIPEPIGSLAIDEAARAMGMPVLVDDGQSAKCFS